MAASRTQRETRSPSQADPNQILPLSRTFCCRLRDPRASAWSLPHECLLLNTEGGSCEQQLPSSVETLLLLGAASPPSACTLHRPALGSGWQGGHCTRRRMSVGTPQGLFPAVRTRRLRCIRVSWGSCPELLWVSYGADLLDRTPRVQTGLQKGL